MVLQIINFKASIDEYGCRSVISNCVVAGFMKTEFENIESLWLLVLKSGFDLG